MKTSFYMEPNANTIILCSVVTAQVCLCLQEVHIFQRDSCISLSVIIEDRDAQFLI